MNPEPATSGDWAVSVIIPFYNEALNVSSLLAELRRVMEALGEGCEVLAVDDGSGDTCLQELRRIAAEWPTLRVIAHLRNRGQAAALWTGFAKARGRIIVTLDGDGQNDPADIPRLLQYLREHSDVAMVTGARVNRQDSPLRRSMSRIANRTRGWILGDGVTDSGCALKAFRREVCGAFLPIRTLYSFMPALAAAAGYQVNEIPVSHRPRTAGVSNYGLLVMLWRPLVDMLGVCWFTRRRFQRDDANREGPTT